MRKVDNPKNRFEKAEVVWEPGEEKYALLHVHEEQSKSILSENDSPDIGFRFSINPYRGCQHACAYCYARPSHQYWGFGAGTDFEREIIVKVNAKELLIEAFEKPSWKGEAITFSGNTDCYQPLEGRYKLTQGLLEICLRYKNPAAIITKSALITRDIDLLAELSRTARLRVFISIPFADDERARAIEPGAAAIHRRFEALEALSAAGIETGVAIAPVMPGLNDEDIPEVLARAKAAGARHAFCTLLRLPAEVKPVFLTRIREVMPLRADKIEHAVREMRGGELYDPRFGARMRGQGPRWNAIETLFHVQCKRLGFGERRMEPDVEPETTTFERPSAQLKLF